MNITLMQVSAVDKLAGQAILGIREVELYTANPPIIPVSLLIDGTVVDVTSSPLFDSDFTTELVTPAVGNPAGTSLWIDVGTGDGTWVKRVEIWWSMNSTIEQNTRPLYASIGVVYDPSVVACDDTYAAGSLQDTVLVHPRDSTVNPWIYTGPLGFVPQKIRCIQLIVFSTTEMRVSQIRITKAEPSIGAAVIASNLVNPELAIDYNKQTSATVPSGVSNPYIMFDLASDYQDSTLIWGISVSLLKIAPGYSLDPENGISMYLCSSGSNDLNACIATGTRIQVILELSDMYTFGPGISCSNCRRVAVVFQPSADSIINGSESLFDVNEISIFASPNLAPAIATVSYRDDRVWSSIVEAANDGISTSFWVSEPDVTSSSLSVSLAGDEPAYYISSLSASFYQPQRNTVIYSSIDGTTWNPTSQGQPFFAKFLRVNMTHASVNASVVSQSGAWSSPLFTVSEITAVTPVGIQEGRNAVASSTVSFSALWFTVPPLAIRRIELPKGETSELSGIVLDWLFAPTAYSIEFWNGQTMALNQTSSFGPGLVASLGTAADSIKVRIGGFANRNGVRMAALRNIQIFKLGTSISLPIPSAPALDDSPEYLTDGDLSTAYTSPSSVTGTVTIAVPLTTATIGKISIVWRTICSSFNVIATRQETNQNVTVFSTTTNSDSVTSIWFAMNVTNLYLEMSQNWNGQNHSYSIYEIQANGALLVTPSVYVDEIVQDNSPGAVLDNSNFSMWMASPVPVILPSNPVTLDVDLGAVYPVKQVSLLWGWAPFSDDWLEDLIASRRDLQVSSDGIVFNSVVSLFRFNSTLRLDLSTERLRFRFLRLVILAPYIDPDLDPQTKLFGPSVKDIKIYLDDNIARDNTDKAVRSSLDGWWNFAPTLTSDGSNSTHWLSQRGQSTAFLISDLGSVKNVAGVNLLFQYIAGTVSFYNSTDCVSYSLLATVPGNTEPEVGLSGQDYQFIARCVKVTMGTAVTQISNPENPSGPKQSIFGVKMFAVMENNGGGGVFGIEAKIGGVWGYVFDTITYAPFQPTQWNMLSNKQLRTSPVNGPTGYDDSSDIVHIVATFSDTDIRLYRNGVPFGSSYAAPTIAWDMVEDVRLVFGVRSSAFADPNNDLSALMGYGKPGSKLSYLSPFYSGQIQSITLISRALLAEEVLGLYEAGKLNLRERGCLCYDACPVGRNKYFPDVDVPCSGQGVCRRAYDPVTGLPKNGYCRCSHGFFGDNCENHCSSFGGCCSVDDDCPTTMTCNVSEYRCV
jgi:hypothetical protein